MQHDEAIWQVIRHSHCSFMAKITTENLCRNPYNVSGKCNQISCPLANSRYATIRNHDGVFYLYMKTIERAHKPNQLWERVKLPRNLENGLKIIDKHLVYWPRLLVNKVKRRFVKFSEMHIRTRDHSLKSREKLMTTPRKQIKREARREEKAEKAALLDKCIEKELVERLNKGLYKLHTKLDENKKVQEEEVEYEDQEDPEIEYVEGNYDDLDDMEDFGIFDGDNAVGVEEMEKCDRKRERRGTYLASKKLEKLKKARVVFEVENEEAPGRQKSIH